MRSAFKKTGSDRFYDCADYLLGKKSIAAHHIVVGGEANEYVARSQILLAYVGIGIDDAENGVFLVSKAENVVDGTLHSGRHSMEYHKTVHDRLFAAYNNVKVPAGTTQDELKALYREAIVKELDNIADTLMYSTQIKLN